MKKILALFCVIMMLGTVWASGTGAGTTITAEANKIVLSFSDGAGGTATKDASADSIADWSDNVIAIHGLLPGTITSTIAGFAEGTPLYIGLAANSNYLFTLPYTNRSNESITVDFSVATLTQAASRWSITADPAKLVAEDALVSMLVTVNSGTAQAFERVTLDTTVRIAETPSTKNVVSYNAFEGAVGDQVGGAYGGVDNISAQYVLEAEGYALTVISRAAEVITAGLPGYTGTPNAPVPGAKIKYTIVVRNDSSSEATNVTVKDAIPAHTHLFVADTPTTTRGGSFVDQDGQPLANATATTIQCQGMNINAGDTATIEYTVTID